MFDGVFKTISHFSSTPTVYRFTMKMPIMRREPAVIEEGAPPPELKKCKKYACSLQKCLEKRNQQIEQCQSHFDAWENCAAIVRENIAAEQARGKDDVKGSD
jgi:hypothetical protein